MARLRIVLEALDAPYGMLKSVLNFLPNLVRPRSHIEDVHRREFILNILLVSCIALLSLALVLQVVDFFFSNPATYQSDTLEFSIVFGILLYFVCLYALSRRGRVTAASYLLVAALFLLPAYLGVRWGVGLPSELVFYPLVIMIASVLISTRFAAWITAFAALALGGTWYASSIGVIRPDIAWQTEKWVAGDVIIILLIYTVTVTVSWLSNREIERSLIRARASEAALIEERDQLEIRVQERTRALRVTQMEKMRQAYRFVEFGRLAGGLFHDLMNPLTAFSLNIESIAHSHGATDSQQLELLAEDVAHAQSATAHIHKLVESLRKHIAQEGTQEQFNVSNILEETVSILASYARHKRAHLVCDVDGEIVTYGDPVALTQVITNLVSNAVEANAKEIQISLQRVNNDVQITVEDTGDGMSPEVLRNIFEPFFSTKSGNGGLGIGLPFAKRIIEKEFGGSIEVTSAPKKGTTFTIHFPIRES